MNQSFKFILITIYCARYVKAIILLISRTEKYTFYFFGLKKIKIIVSAFVALT